MNSANFLYFPFDLLSAMNTICVPSYLVPFLSLIIPSFHLVNCLHFSSGALSSSVFPKLWFGNPLHPLHRSISNRDNVNDVYNPVANLSSSWTKKPSDVPGEDVTSDDKSVLKPILGVSDGRAGFVFGFFCNYNCDGYLLAVLIFPSSNVPHGINQSVKYPKVVWSANRNRLISANATLLVEGGSLVLKEGDSEVWSTKTSGKSVASLHLTEAGNVLLLDNKNQTVWQSFDHPTDSLVPGQKLNFGQKLIASVSERDWSQGLISFCATRDRVAAYVGSDPPLEYFSLDISDAESGKNPSNSILFDSLSRVLSSGKVNWNFLDIPAIRYMKLEPSGKFIVYEWGGLWDVSFQVFYESADCAYPLRCGRYGICFNGQCSCPVSAGDENIYFRPVSQKEPDLGCYEVTPLSSEAFHLQSLLQLNDTFFFPAFSLLSSDSDIEGFKQACLKNLSCKAVMCTSLGCTLLSEIFSLMNFESETYSLMNLTILLKVQNVTKPEPPPPKIAPPSPNAVPSSPMTASPSKKTVSTSAVIVVSSFSAIFSLYLILLISQTLFLKRKDTEEDVEYRVHQVPGMPTRFSYQILVVATENFRHKLGEGGFGSVFEGILCDGTKVAVKCLNGLAQTKDSFLAEVQTIGGIHHLNLVKLIGYCANKSKFFLVYEYMCNGPLDKWIFHRNQELALDWQTRRKIILDIAKGLTYLHEECQKKIVHLDIKPQNILLDKNFNAKVSDFGLSKLMDRDQSQVVTSLRGTLGYLAPEWFNSAITEKVDVYSFGIVTLEILCGRKNLDHSLPEKDMHLLSLFKLKVDEDRLTDLVDKYNGDMQLHGAEAVEMMKLAAWCLQSDICKRPTMSMVVKVLEGVMDVEDDLEYCFFNPPFQRGKEAVGHEEFIFASPVLPSFLSGPR